jgi:hypothetical protein
MTLPTVTELPLKLEPVTPDTFIEGPGVLTSTERPPAEAQTSVFLGVRPNGPEEGVLVTWGPPRRGNGCGSR